MQIDSVAFWTAVGVVSVFLIAIVGWAIAMERRVASRMTFDQHKSLCDKANQTMIDSFKEVLKRIDEQRGDVRSIDTKVDQLTIDVAVLKSRMDGDGR